MKPILLGLLVILLVPVSWALINYGTISPCQIAAKEVVAVAVASAEKQTGSSEYGLLGKTLTLALFQNAAEIQLAEFGPVGCTKVVWWLKTGGIDTGAVLERLGQL